MESIAHRLKQKVNRNVERVFMLYFLSDMENGAWATTHFESNKYTIEQENKLMDDFKTEHFYL